MRERKEPKYRAKPAFTGLLACIMGDVSWNVVDLNIERKTVDCPNCGTRNDIDESIKRARLTNDQPDQTTSAR